jgi:DNA-binding CsgD family transcriptional regulator
MGASSSDLSATIQQMYSSAAMIDDAAGADAVRSFVGAEHVVFVDAVDDRSSWRACSNITPDHYGKMDTITGDSALYDKLAAIEAGQVVLQSTLIANEVMRDAPIYQSCIEPIEGGLSAVVLWREPRTFASVHVCRSLKRARDFTTDDVDRLAALVPHIRTSQSLRRHAATAGKALDAMISVLDATPLGIVALDHAGAMMFANAQASRLLDGRNGLVLQDRRVRCVASQPAEHLARSIAAVLGLRTQTPSDAASAAGLSRLTVSVPRAKPMAPLSVSIAPPASLTGLSPPPSEVGAVLLIRDPDLMAWSAEAELVGLYDLTRREAQLSARLIKGDTLTAAAGRLGITPGTARQYLKRVFDKTGVHRQPDLVRLLLQPTL